MALSIHESFRTKAVLGLLLVLFLSVAAFAKLSPVTELHQTGLYGRIHAWNKQVHKWHRVPVNVPKNAPIIISDYHSRVGANGLRRAGEHKGIDIFAKTGTPIIAAADGLIVRTKIDRCWGPTVLINHGLDKRGRTFYALYGHMKNIRVKPGQRIKRGQKIAEMGEDIFTTCGAGIHHLHFQISYSPRYIPIFGWGWSNFVMDGSSAPNPHKYWEGGEGIITCFEKGKRYSKSGLTYPVPCNGNGTNNQTFPERTIFAKNRTKVAIPKRVVQLSPSEKTFASRFLNQERLSKKTRQYPRRNNPSSSERRSTLQKALLSSLERVLAEEARMFNK